MKTITEEYLKSKLMELFDEVSIADFSEDELIDFVTSKYSKDEVMKWWKEE